MHKFGYKIVPNLHSCLAYVLQVCWEKFARYLEVELKEAKLKEDYYVMDLRTLFVWQPSWVPLTMESSKMSSC